MRDVHASFTGESGTIARFGDSIFVSQAFFVPLAFAHQNVPLDTQVALDWIQGYLAEGVWGWQSPGTGADGGKTSDWPLQADQNPPERNIDHWLNTLNPEMAIIMWGTNDVQFMGSVDAYVANLREVVRTAKDNGTIPILTSIPPRSGYEVKSHQYAQAVAELALEEGVPLVHYHEEILERAPGDTWDGSLVYDGTGSVYEVQRLVSGDGIHPSNPNAYRQNFSEDALDRSGFTLLNYLTLRTTFDVFQQVIAPGSSTLSGDYNGNGNVDAADYVVWRKSNGPSTDYDIWRTHYGQSISGSGSSIESASVPEPSTLLLLGLGAISLLGYRKAKSHG